MVKNILFRSFQGLMRISIVISLISVSQSHSVLGSVFSKMRQFPKTTLCCVGAGAATLLIKNSHQLNQKTSMDQDVLSDAALTFFEMKALPIEERRKAFFELCTQKDDTQIEKNNRELAFIIDEINGLCEYKSEDFEKRVTEFEKRNKSYDINAVAGLNSSDDLKSSFLHKAAGNVLNDDSARLIKFLVEKGAPVNALDGQGWTPLHHAVFYSRADAVEALLHSGANKAIKDEKGRTALDLSEQRGNPYHGTIAGQNDRRIRELLTGVPFKQD